MFTYLPLIIQDSAGLWDAPAFQPQRKACPHHDPVSHQKRGLLW